VSINPVTHVVTALRDLMNRGTVTLEVGWALLGCAAIAMIFIPLAVHSYTKRV
jgi:ABC-2 type transport system permease protein